jgi:hypothetical protein
VKQKDKLPIQSPIYINGISTTEQDWKLPEKAEVIEDGDLGMFKWQTELKIMSSKHHLQVFYYFISTNSVRDQMFHASLLLI